MSGSRTGSGRYDAARRLTAVVTGLGTALGLAVVAGTPAHAEVNSIVVTTLADSGPGSLREALAQAQASAADDHVTFAPSVTGTVELTSGELEAVVGGAHGDLTIEGPGRDLLDVDAGGRSRVLHVRGPGGDTRPSVVVSGLTLTHGHVSRDEAGPVGGGAVRATGADLTLDRVVVSDSSVMESGGGGVLVDGGSLLVTGSTIARNDAGGDAYGGGGLGGGISFDGAAAAGAALEVRDTIVSGNFATVSGAGIHAVGDVPAQVAGTTVQGNETGDYLVLGTEAVRFVGFGGGIFADRLTLLDSHVTGNEAGQHGGGLAGRALTVIGSTIDHNVSHRLGGGIWVGADSPGEGELRVTNSTIAGNRADDAGGGIHVAGDQPVELALSTIADNVSVSGGGVWSGADVTLRGTVVAASAGGDLAGGGSATFSRSLVEDPRAFSYVDLGGSIVGKDPLLGPVGDHGGPVPTMLPASSSPVIDEGSAFGTTTDQRGLPRPVDDPEVPDADDGSDIGAVELTGAEQAGPPQVASTAPPVITGTVRVGETLHTDGGTWAPADVSLAYQWLRDGRPIRGETGASYTLTARDFGQYRFALDERKRVAVRVTATTDGHQEEVRTSDFTRYVRRGRLETSRPAKVKGRTRVGRILRARPRAGAVSPEPTDVVIKWYLDDVEVRRARDDRRLELTRRMRGDRVTVRFIYRRAPAVRDLRQVVEKRRRVR